MGAAEYEFGTIPRMFKELVRDSKQLKAFKFTIERSELAVNPGRAWEERKQAKGKAVVPPVPSTPVTIYALCRKAQADQVEKRIRAIAAEKIKVRDSPQLSQALDPIREWDRKIVGWLELNNGFFWFIDEEMWKNTAAMFGLEVP
jgi:hypothetical protein